LTSRRALTARAAGPMACFEFCFPSGRAAGAAPRSLLGASVILTGASEGLGVSIAQHLAAEGVAKLAIAARRRPRLEQVAAELRAKHPAIAVLVVEADVSKHADCERLVSMTLAAFGGCDVLVNNAGVLGLMHFESAPAERMDQVIDINLKGPMYLARCVLPAMIKAGKGHILNVASVGAKVPKPYNAVYNASKFGLIGWSHGLRAEMRVKRTGVSVGCVCPGFIRDVGMAAGQSRDLGVSAALQRAMDLCGSLSPDEVADGVIRALRFDLPELLVDSKLTPRMLARRIGLDQWMPDRLDHHVVQPPVLAWLAAVADGQERLPTK